MADGDGGCIRRGLLYKRQGAEYIKYLQSSICTHRTVYSYIIIHYISVRRDCKHVPVARSYSLRQYFEV